MSFIQQLQNISGHAPVSRRRALLGLSLLVLAACSRSKKTVTHAPSNVLYYTCTMHPFVRSQDPNGRCPVCGMSLVPVYQKTTGTAPAGATTAIASVEESGLVHIPPEKMREIGATTEEAVMRPLTVSLPAPARIRHGLLDDGAGELATVNRLTISTHAVLPTGNQYLVFVDHGDGKLEPRAIGVGLQTPNYVEVVSGLKEGDRVISGANFLVDAESRIQGVLKTWGDQP